MDRPNRVRAGICAAVLCLIVPVSARAGGLSFVEYDRATSSVANGLDGAVDVTVVGDQVYVVGERDDAVSVWLRDFLTNTLELVQVVEDGFGGVVGMGHPNAIAGTNDGHCMYVATSDNPPGPGGFGTVVAFDRNVFAGGLAYLETKVDGVGGVDGIRGASAIVIPFDDAHVYVASETDNAIAIFGRTAPACALTYLGMVQNGVGGVLGLARPLGLAVSPGGDNIYAAARTSTGKGAVGSVVVFDRNATTGALTYREHELDEAAGVDHLVWPVSAVVVSGYGDAVYAASQGGDAVVAFSRDAGTGALTFLETERRAGVVKGIKGASGLAMSFSDDYLFVTGRGDDAIAVFKRDLATGKLDFLELHQDVVPEVNVLGGAEAVAIASDFYGGVFVVGSRADTVVSFNADRCGDGHVGSDEQCDGGAHCLPSCRLDICGPMVTGTCHAATAGGGASLLIKDDGADRRDRVKWTWKGAMTSLPELGDPVTTASYVLCIYDASVNPQPILSRAAPAGGVCDGKPCWIAKPTGFQYSDKVFTPDGVKSVQLKADPVDGKPKVQVQGTGDFIDPPTLPLTLPVTVQVKNTQNAECWEATYHAFIKNDPTKFTGKSD